MTTTKTTDPAYISQSGARYRNQPAPTPFEQFEREQELKHFMENHEDDYCSTDYDEREGEV